MIQQEEKIKRLIHENFPFEEFREHQEDAIFQTVQAFLDGKKFVVIESPTGCHHKGQKVLMFDGSLKTIETISVGDRLMGIDSKPRTVLYCIQGNELLMRIRPKKGEPWIVNKSHILSLVRTNDGTKKKNSIVDISLDDYLKKSKWFKHTHKLFKVPVDFSTQNILLDPYCLGLWLGSPQTTTRRITTQDQITKNYIRKIEKRYKNFLQTSYQKIGLTNEKEKCIPSNYLINNREIRLKVLAGLLDSCGNYSGTYSIITEFSRLKDDILYLCRSLGFSAYSSEVHQVKRINSLRSSFQISIGGDSGDLKKIPVLFDQKKVKKKTQKKNVLRTGFSIEPLKNGNYYGFILDGDGRYILNDFTVTHNSGKSVIAYTASKVIQILSPSTPRRQKVITEGRNPGPHTIVTVQTRPLQTQYESSFADMPLIWSSANFGCAAMPYEAEAHWGSWQCKKTKCAYINQCEFYHALKKFRTADIGVTNYAYFLHQKSYSPANITMDEAHNLEEVLCEWMKVSLSKKFLLDFFDQLLVWNFFDEDKWSLSRSTLISLLEITSERKNWLSILRDLAKDLLASSLIAFESIEKHLENCRKGNSVLRTEEGKKMSRLSTYFRNLATKLNLLVRTKTDWVIAERTMSDDIGTQTISFKPLYVQEISKYFFSQAEFFIFLSATICGVETMMKYLGIGPNKYHYISVPSIISKRNRPVFAIKNIGKLSYNNRKEMLPVFVEYLDLILDSQFQGIRGIIHSVSYENSKFIEENSRFSSRMKFPQTEQLTEIISLLQSSADTIVVSPSITEGLDLKEDLCRFTIFFKVPWASLKDEWIKKRKDDPLWYARKAAIKIVQGAGRGTRSKHDYSTTLILDGSFSRIWFNHREVLPEWFQDAVQLINL